ncbi:MAG TPA: tRNA (adenosine(37)-N6)-dimethylallyltransferase MiaA [Prolixibacteraceae bacterium]|nr:tRNA (adenosine(37)-N6)-dimethylallyltransferase MiaA [Prolixibacteraceae bacterium]
MNKTAASTLIVLLGPTGVGKTALSLSIAKHFQTEIISCDSRQLYREMSVGTAVPEKELQELVPHHFIQSHSITDRYNAARFESDVLELLKSLFLKHPVVLMTGGSMLYIDAVCKGIDDLPDIDPELRTTLVERMKQEGIENLRAELKLLDPEYYREADLQNPARIIHALEICYMTGRSFSSQRTKTSKERDFRIVKIGLNRDRTELYDRINMRVDAMMQSGLEEEARRLFPYRDLNNVHTVGYRELFDYFEGLCTREEAVERIKANTRKYARKQLTWFRKDPGIHWFHPDQSAGILEFLTK